MTDWIIKLLCLWGVFSIIAFFILLVIYSGERKSCDEPKLFMWNNFCLFVQFYLVWVFYAFLAALALAVIDSILFGLAKWYVHWHGYDLYPCDCGL